MALTLSAVAALVQGELEGDGAASIEGLAGLAEAQRGQLSFFGSPKYLEQLKVTRASAVLAPVGAPVPQGVAAIRVAQPHLAFARVAQALQPKNEAPPGVSPRAEVHPTAMVHPTAHVGAFAVVEAGATVAEHAVISALAYVGRGAQVGAHSVLHPHAVVYAGCVVGKRCVLHSGAVVGKDGFGFAFDAAAPGHVRIPQTGIARLEDDVELGAQSCVDRATFGETVVGQGTKVDNLVQIAHNVKVGAHSILCAQAGVSGSATLGQGVVLAGQVGVAGHITVGDLSRIGAQAGVAQDVEPGSTLLGAPAIEHRQFFRAATVFNKLPELWKQVRSLVKRLEALEEGRGKHT
ncbi:MAG: UDP-3-O-(3-hydroxymyristoyl)glucosamine N-acyltransferase [Myxococcaceae bacterium]|nr:UDP-3-O-(3-hydroxymyristoyl)glucosamine N-acyltransferase [Myxococcaceae bacterium]